MPFLEYSSIIEPVCVLSQQALVQGKPHISEIKFILTPRKECNVRVFENRMLKELFRPKGQEAGRYSRKKLNEEL
jgi:hypothetical protein